MNGINNSRGRLVPFPSGPRRQVYYSGPEKRRGVRLTGRVVAGLGRWSKNRMVHFILGGGIVDKVSVSELCGMYD